MDFLKEKQQEITARMRELEPAVAEYARLEAAHAALNGIDATSGIAKSTNSGGAKRGRTRGSGVRAQQAIEVIKKHPGITVAELAERSGIGQNYLYRVLPVLAESGQARKEGKGWHPA
jgi:hypothetical protein